MLRARDLIRAECLMDLNGEGYLNPRLRVLDAVCRSVIQCNPVGENIMGIKALDQKKGFIHR